MTSTKGGTPTRQLHRHLHVEKGAFAVTSNEKIYSDILSDAKRVMGCFSSERLKEEWDSATPKRGS